jgi:transposase
MANQRKKYPPEKKVEILREHLKNQIPISELCEKYGVHPNMFYKWRSSCLREPLRGFALIGKETGKRRTSSGS